jgi:hypothetical protein
MGWECIPVPPSGTVPAGVVVTLAPGGVLPDFTMDGFLRAMATDLVVMRPEERLAAGREADTGRETAPQDRTGAEMISYALPAASESGTPSGTGAGTRTTPEEAARVLLEHLGLGEGAGSREPYAGPIERVTTLPSARIDEPTLWFLPEPPGEGETPEWSRGTRAGLETAAALADALGLPLAVAALLPKEAEERLRACLSPLLAARPARIVLATSPALAGASERGFREAFETLFLRSQTGTHGWTVATEWAHRLLARASHTLSERRPHEAAFHPFVKELHIAADHLLLARAVFDGRLRVTECLARSHDSSGSEPHAHFMTLDGGARVVSADSREDRGPAAGDPEVYHLQLALSYDRRADRLPPFFAPDEREGPNRRSEGGRSAESRMALRDAECILDVGYGIGSRDNLDRLVLPLQRVLEVAGAQRVAIGGTRRVTEELKLLPPDAQIGQTGTPVNPAALIALGVSGAPQHLDYIADSGIVLAFNRDPDAPMMTLNQRRPTPRVYAVVGDLFETLPRFTTALRRLAGLPEAAPPSLKTAAVGGRR